ncbi:MAG: tetratricopeptide repeat protein [Rhodospirillaceae bacterium]
MTDDEIREALDRIEKCIEEERPKDAVADLQAILAAHPNHPEALCGVGRVSIQFGDNEAAVNALDHAVKSKPGFWEARNARAVALQNLGRLAEAEAEARAVVRIHPGAPGACLNLAGILAAKGDYADAREAFRSVLELRPDDATATYNLGLVDLVEGNFAEGWKGFEFRDRASNVHLAAARSTRPKWSGEAPPPGATLLVHAEQGLGDNIQFIRYVPRLAKKFGAVIVETPPPLAGLLSSTPGVDRFVARDDPLPDHDLFVPIMSLPNALMRELDYVYWPGPYLAAPDARVAEWRARITRRPGDLHVGLVWAGNANHKRDRDRSMHLRDLEPLLIAEGVAFHSLQIGAADDQIAETAFADRMRPLFRRVYPFADVAAAVAALDLVICVDTSIAHLAGAMGRPVWTLISKVPDWRWMVGRVDTPWYPSMRLYRQETVGDWASAVEKAEAALRHRDI